MRQHNRLMVTVLLIAGLPLSGCQRESGKQKAEPPAQIERIEGTTLSRVTLTEKAIERLGLKTDRVREEKVARNRMVGGEVVALPAASETIASRSPSVPVPGTDLSKGETVYRQFAPGQVVVSEQAPSEVPDRSRVGVRVRLPEGDLRQVAQGQPARVLPLARGGGDDDEGAGLRAQPVEDDDDDTEGAGRYYAYVVEGAEHRLVPGQRVRVALPLSGGGTKRKVVPYSALIYDPHGQTWIYTSPKPRTFVRHKVEVDYIQGKVAVLKDGPPTGTVVASVGVAELYGTEFKVGH